MLAKAFNSLQVFLQVRRQQKVPFLSAEEVHEIQNQRVHSIVAHAYQTVPYYRANMDRLHLKPSDFQTAQDLSQLPTLSKEQLNKNPAAFLSTAFDPSRRLAMKSSATTGRAAAIFYDFDALFLNLACASRELEAVTRVMGKSPLLLREVAILVPEGTVRTIREFYSSQTYLPIKRLTLSTFAPLQQNLTLINRFRPHLLTGYASYLGVLFLRLLQGKINFPLPKAILTISDHFPEHIRRRVEEELGVPVFSSYGACEALRIGFCCEERKGFHIHTDLCHVMIKQDKGQQNEIVISNLTNKAMVILNYRIGDLGSLSTQACPCGRTLPILQGLVGRADEVILLPGERFVIPWEVHKIFKARMDLLDYQVVQKDVNDFTVQVVPYGDGEFGETETELSKDFKRLFGEETHIRVEPVEIIPTLPNGKIRRIFALQAVTAGYTPQE